ncbi:penicillin-binding transpeptidase domain-containing protein [Streptomyces apocyni]|uniref:penicillin-binding transpeptidase domain-containing protein n=1 Tax=Streptomyces apocyni TaxID=2654677 RepID=UPI0012EA2469|nr:penicillin-binding transpeptidase domain-containing protein [Streptomyces apocyni]
MRNGAKHALIGGVFAVMVGGAGYGAWNLVSDTTGSGTDNTASDKPAASRTGPPSGDEVRETAEKFLAAWAKGEAAEAADYTNNRPDANTAIADYASETHITKVKLTSGEAVGAKVPFSVEATVSYEGKSKPLAYEGELTVVRGETTKRPLVDWAPSVIHPELGEDDTLRLGEASSPEIKAVDRDNRELTAEKYPSLSTVLPQLRERYGESAKGTPGVELWIERGDGLPDKTLVTLRKGKPGLLRTTLDADVQAGAEKAVKRYAESSVVAIKPSTGEIRAVANNREDGWNAAFEGEIAPGSTMKIVTAAMLINNNLVNANGPAECTPDAMWFGTKFTNLNGFSIPGGGTFKESFARSCNTAFIKPINGLGDRDETALGTTAKQYFGIGLDWNVGVTTRDGKVPRSSGSETAASYIGQGKVQLNPLNVASISATAKEGVFKQPIIVPLSLDDRQPAQATPLPTGTARQLRDMMRLTATAPYGTGRTAMAGLGGDKGAKTGSAEVDNATADSWFTGFHGDLAAAAVARAGGHGSDAAAPLVASVLGAGG